MWGWMLAVLLVAAALFAAVLNPEAASKLFEARDREDDGIALLPASRPTPLDAVVVTQYSAAPLEERVPHATATTTPGVRSRMSSQLLGYL